MQSLFIEMYFNEQILSSGTGFLVERGTRVMLVTNRHNVTGRDQVTNQTISPTGGVPNRLRVWRTAAGNPGRWMMTSYALYDGDDRPLWIEHPQLGANADFVALIVDTPFGVMNYPYSTERPSGELILRPAETVSVIGFPFGQSAGGLFGIWVSGFLASEMDVNYDGKPVFLIDCRTRKGQSGSPVIAIRYGTWRLKDGTNVMALGEHCEFLGIYSGRINKESDLGMVWKREAINELIQSIS